MSEQKKAEKIIEYGEKGNFKKASHYCGDGSPLLRAAAAQALGKIHSADSNNELTSMIHDSDVKVQKEVVKSLGKIGYKSSAEYIRHAMNNTADEELSQLCREALDYISQNGSR